MTSNMKKKKKMTRDEIIYHAVLYPVFILFALLCAYPFYYLLICTVSENKLVDLGKILLIPRGFHLDNYVKVLETAGFLRSMLVSVVRVVVATGARLLVCSYAAYFFTKQGMWKRKLWYRFTIIPMYFAAGMIPKYMNWRMFGLLNSFWIYVIPGMMHVYNMILIKTSIEALPPDLEESAYLDGAGYMARLFRIVLPLQKPILATVGLFSAVEHWNDYFVTKLYITNTNLYTVQFKLYELLNQVRSIAESDVGAIERGGVTPVAIRMTMTAVVVIPVMVFYPFIQRYYVKGVMIGAVKG